MLRFALILFLSSLFFLTSCVKPVSKSPIPVLTYKAARDFAITPAGNDTAVVVYGFEDGDGNLFVDDFSQSPNVIITTKYFNSDSGRFVTDKSVSNKIKQPDRSYKGKAIKGDIILPLVQFRSNNSRKIIMFELFMVDLSNNKSNVITSPAYTLNI